MVTKSINLQKPSVSLLVVNLKGSILIVALWSLCILTTFAVVLGYTVRQKIVLVQRLDERSRLQLIAQAGIKKAIALLKNESYKPYAVLKDIWSSNINAFKDIAVDDGTCNIFYSYPDELSGSSVFQYGLIDEERKININKVDSDILKRLFQIVLGFNETEAMDLAASIIDWRDNDSQLSSPLGGAEDFYYRGLRYSYEAKDQEFEILDELLLVRGMDGQTLEKIKDYITIYGDGKININTASKVVLLALGLNENIVDKILLFRQGEDRIIATPDDNVFEETSEIVPKLSQMYSLSDSEIAQISGIVDGYLTTNANNFMIKSSAKLNNRRNIWQVGCVVNREGRVLYWQES